MGSPGIIVKSVKSSINGYFIHKEPWQIVTVTASGVLVGVWLWEFLFQDESIWSRSKKKFFQIVRLIPAVSRKINSTMSDINSSFQKEVVSRVQGTPYITVLPDKGMEPKEIIETVEKHLSLGDYKWKEGYVSGAVYYYNQNLINLLTKVYGLASYTNPLHPDVFPGVCKMEAEVVRICTNLFNAGPESCGTMTTGGTESILMACKAYRNYAWEKGIKHPEMVLPVTAHPAFHKAAEYFGIQMKLIPIDPVTTKVDIRALKRAISGRTCMLVGSAPNYPYGTMDDIEAIAALAVKYDIPLHVDACLGGFVVVFMKKCGFSIPPFDFSVRGVTSISADTHKYGYAPKGSSVILYSHQKYRHHQFTVSTDWPGGVYGSPTINGSRAGGIIAACWATIMHFGLDGYVECTKKIIETTKYIEKGLREMDGIFVFGSPVSSVIAIGSNDFHIYRLSDALTENGWNLNPLQFPSGLHLCVTLMHTQEGVADRFLSDVRHHLNNILQHPQKQLEGKFAMYGMSHSISDRSIVGDFTRFFLDSMYYTPEENQPNNSKALL